MRALELIGATLHRRGKAAVIGGGLSGLWLSYELARRGYSVTLYEANSIGYGASSRAAGIISLQLPAFLLKYATDGFRAYLEAGLERVVRSLWIPRQDELHCIKCITSFLSSEGIYAELMKLEEVNEKLSGLAGNGDEPVVMMDQGMASPGDAINFLTRALSMMDFSVKYGPVLRKGNRLLHEGLPIEADLTFVAAGPWTPLLVNVNGNLKIYRCAAHSVKGDVPDIIVEDDINGFYIVPESRDQAIIGGWDSELTRPEDGFRLSSPEAYEVLELVATRLPRAESFYPVSSWAAPCVSGADGLPVVGKLDEVYVLTGLNGAGLTLSPGLSRLLVDIAEGIAKEDERLSPSRLLKGRLSGPEEPFDRLCD
jgi:glycine/D-amino acid oxidase-like deaminating enzyme